MARWTGVVVAALVMALGSAVPGEPAAAEMRGGAAGGPLLLAQSNQQGPAAAAQGPAALGMTGTFAVLRTTNIRAEPSTASDALGRLSQYDTVQVTGQSADGQWLQIDHGGRTAFVFASLVRRVDAAEASSWQAASGGDRTALERYLSTYPAGVFADAARQILGSSGGAPALQTPPPGVVPSDHLDRLLGEQGDWVQRFGVNAAAANPPPQFAHFFLLPEVLSGDYVDAGAIVTGSEWDDDGAPLWCVAYGYSQGDGCWYITLSRLIYLGPDWEPRFATWADSVNGRSGRGVGQFFGRPYALGGDTGGGAGGAMADGYRTQQGAWLRDFGVNEAAVSPPDVFRHYFLQLDTIGGDYVDAGAIVTGDQWDTDGIPRWCTVYGYSQDDGCWYLVSSELVYLGPTWQPGWTAISDTINAASGKRLGVFYNSAGQVGGAASGGVGAGGSVGGDQISGLQARVGQWVTEFGVDQYAANPPPQYGHYFIMGGLTDDNIDAGAIVRGGGWDDDGLPMWCVVYGRSTGDGCWYLFLNELTYLGPEWRPEYARWSDELNGRIGRSTQSMFNRPHERFGY